MRNVKRLKGVNLLYNVENGKSGWAILLNGSILLNSYTQLHDQIKRHVIKWIQVTHWCYNYD